MTTADQYRKRGATITKSGKWRRIAADRIGLEKMVKALEDMADNEDWLKGKTELKPIRRKVTNR